MEIKARFAPSPTGQVHIGNIRTAIFNWLFARHEKGTFLLRIEDTDLERSTQAAIRTLLECMDWLGMDYDGEAMYQTTQAPKHLQAAADLEKAGFAYHGAAQDGKPGPLFFRLPYDCDAFSFVRQSGPVELAIAPGTEVLVNGTGLTYQTVTPKGKIADNQYCLAGFKDLKIVDEAGNAVFTLDQANLNAVWNENKSFQVSGGAKLVYGKREVFYHDLVKGDMAKGLDSMRDFIIVRSDGSPVFHLANVCDDITQGVTHIVRGDDHVENTFRHLFLFQTLGYPVPVYAHLPMIVNQQGKPYSKRDGDAFVGDFKDKGYLPEALFNYMTLLGWAPGDNREKMTRAELIEAFHIEKAQHSPAQFDIRKLSDMNGQYIAELPVQAFADMAWDFASRWDWRNLVPDRAAFDRVAAFLQSRTKILTDVNGWKYFFTRDYEFDPKAVKKFMSAPEIRQALPALADAIEKLPEPVDPKTVEDLLRALEKEFNMKDFALNQPLRVAATGVGVGAGMYETVQLLGAGETAKRIRMALAKNPVA